MGRKSNWENQDQGMDQNITLERNITTQVIQILYLYIYQLYLAKPQQIILLYGPNDVKKLKAYAQAARLALFLVLKAGLHSRIIFHSWPALSMWLLWGGSLASDMEMLLKIKCASFGGSRTTTRCSIRSPTWTINRSLI